jgi:uncharacterized lipoprotein YddW (UPF0748 family)
MIKRLKITLLLFAVVFCTQLFTETSAQEIKLQSLPTTQCLSQTSGHSEVVFSQKTYPISSIDPTLITNSTASYYPGLRGANQMIVYTPTYGLRTNTNEFGSEAIVEGNVVTALSGADSIIPLDGLVISGHGAAKKWINENIILGSKVYVNKDSKILTVYVTSDSFIFSAKQKIKEAQDMSCYYKQYFPLYDSSKSENSIWKAQIYLNKAEKDTKNVQKYSSLAIEAANKALETSIPYKKDELKGVWLRPTETTELQIINTLNRLQAAGVNNIFLETYFHGQTIFPSETMANYQFTSQNPRFAGIDPLKIWITEAHKRNIKVNIWFETFYVGNENPKSNPKSILAVNPDWGNVTKRDCETQTMSASVSEHGGYFLDPANPDVQDYLEDLIKEIICRYHPDGINLDYIRYPQSIAAKYAGYDLSNWGYTEYARADFKTHYGIDPYTITTDSPNWALWAKYRQDKITNFVIRISNITKPRNILLTTVIFPDRQKALETKEQDWKTWTAFNYVDGFTPLFLTCDPKTAAAMMQDIIRNKNHNTALYAGLFITFMDGSNDDLIRQIHEARKAGAKGIIIFDYAHFKDKYVKALTASVFAPQQPVTMDQNQCVKVPEIAKKHHRKFFRFRKNNED